MALYFFLQVAIGTNYVQNVWKPNILQILHKYFTYEVIYMIIHEVPSAKYQVIFKGLINWEKFSNSPWVYGNTEAYYILLVR